MLSLVRLNAAEENTLSFCIKVEFYRIIEESGVTASLRWPGIVNRIAPVLGVAHQRFLLNVDETFTRRGGIGRTHTG